MDSGKPEKLSFLWLCLVGPDALLQASLGFDALSGRPRVLAYGYWCQYLVKRLGFWMLGPLSNVMEVDSRVLEDLYLLGEAFWSTSSVFVRPSGQTAWTFDLSSFHTFRFSLLIVFPWIHLLACRCVRVAVCLEDLLTPCKRKMKGPKLRLCLGSWASWQIMNMLGYNLLRVPRRVRPVVSSCYPRMLSTY